MKKIAIVMIALGMAAVGCRAPRVVGGTAAVEAVVRDTVTVSRTDTLRQIVTRHIERPVVVVEHLDSPRRRIVFAARSIADSAAVAASSGEVTERSTVAVSSSQTAVSEKTVPRARRWLWLLAGALAGFILRSFAGTRSRR